MKYLDAGMLSLQKCHLSKFQFSILSLKKRVFIAMLRNKIITVFIFFAGLFFLSCNTTEPENKPVDFEFTAEDVSCTEAWLTLKVNDIAGAKVYRGDSLLFNLTQQSIDTTLYDEGLLPNHVYKYHTTIQPYNHSNVITKELTIQTMDTTTHNFTWQTFTFGEAGSSTFYDVAIINENNIWAVGEIYMNDSFGNPDPISYNALHWNGQSWELKKIKTNACGGVDYPPIKAIFAFSSNDILFAHIDGSLSHFNGIKFTNDCSLITQLNGSANKIWGISKNDFYVVSGNGFVAHYQNGSWRKIESGTTTSIKNVWGVHYNDLNSFILCAVTNVASAGDRKILRINNNNVINFLWDTGRRVQSIWFKNSSIIYTCGGGVFVLRMNNHWEEIIEIPLYYTEEIRGNDINDIMVVGDFGLLVHFNGISWKIFNNPAVDIYYSCAVTENLAAAVGTKGSQAIIAIANK